MGRLQDSTIENGTVGPLNTALRLGVCNYQVRLDPNDPSGCKYLSCGLNGNPANNVLENAPALIQAVFGPDVPEPPKNHASQSNAHMVELLTRVWSLWSLVYHVLRKLEAEKGDVHVLGPEMRRMFQSLLEFCEKPLGRDHANSWYLHMIVVCEQYLEVLGSIGKFSHQAVEGKHIEGKKEFKRYGGGGIYGRKPIRGEA